MTSAPVMLVTGGSRGIGRETALLAAQRGYDVCVNYASDEAAAQEVVAGVLASGRRAIAVRGDVGSEADVVGLFETCDRELGTPAALVNNAGLLGIATRVDRYDAARLQRVMATNVIGSILCAREAVLRMSTAHGGAGGAIVNVSSVAARLGSPGMYVDYAASKGAIETFTVGLAREVAREGVRVMAVRPGIIDTEIHASSNMPDRVADEGPGVPLGRAGAPGEVATAILWLLSAEASYSTGAILDVAGGR